MDKALRAHYVRQFRKSGWAGNGGGWVYGPRGARMQGWDALIRHLAMQWTRWGQDGIKNGAVVRRRDGVNDGYVGTVVAQLGQRTVVRVAWALPSRPDVVVGQETHWTYNLVEVN